MSDRREAVMSDRREAVALTISEALDANFAWEDDIVGLESWHRTMGRIADVAIAAYERADPTDEHAAVGLPKGLTLDTWDDRDQAEPTEAEIGAAYRTWLESDADDRMWDGCGAGAESVTCRQRNRMRAALIAARTARTEAQE